VVGADLWSNDTVWEALLPEEARRLPAVLAAVDAYLDDERFLAPWRAQFDRRLGRQNAWPARQRP
jgi:transposase, IS5 family